MFQRVSPSVRYVASVVRCWCSWITAQWLGLRGLHPREETTDLLNQHHDVVDTRGHLPSNNNVAFKVENYFFKVKISLFKVENILLHISKFIYLSVNNGMRLLYSVIIHWRSFLFYCWGSDCYDSMIFGSREMVCFSRKFEIF